MSSKPFRPSAAPAFSELVAPLPEGPRVVGTRPSGRAVVFVAASIACLELRDALAAVTPLNTLGACSGGVIHRLVRLQGARTRVAEAAVTLVAVDGKTGQALLLEGELWELLEKVGNGAPPEA